MPRIKRLSIRFVPSCELSANRHRTAFSRATAAVECRMCRFPAGHRRSGCIARRFYTAEPLYVCQWKRTIKKVLKMKIQRFTSTFRFGIEKHSIRPFVTHTLTSLVDETTPKYGVNRVAVFTCPPFNRSSENGEVMA